MLQIYETWILHRSELTKMANILFHYALKPLWPNDRSLYRSVSNSCSGGATISPLQHLARCVARCACTRHKTPRESILKILPPEMTCLPLSNLDRWISGSPKTGFLSCAATNSFLPSPAERSLLGRIKSTSSRLAAPSTKGGEIYLTERKSCTKVFAWNLATKSLNWCVSRGWENRYWCVGSWANDSVGLCRRNSSGWSHCFLQRAMRVFYHVETKGPMETTPTTLSELSVPVANHQWWPNVV